MKNLNHYIEEFGIDKTMQFSGLAFTSLAAYIRAPFNGHFRNEWQMKLLEYRATDDNFNPEIYLMDRPERQAIFELLISKHGREAVKNALPVGKLSFRQLTVPTMAQVVTIGALDYACYVLEGKGALHV